MHDFDINLKTENFKHVRYYLVNDDKSIYTERRHRARSAVRRVTTLVKLYFSNIRCLPESMRAQGLSLVRAEVVQDKKANNQLAE